VKSLVSIIASAVVMAFTGAAFAAADAPQPLTRAACEQAGMKWKDRANVCGPRKHHDKEKKAEAKKEKGEAKDLMQRQPQPLTRADCNHAGMRWNDKANVCGVKSAHKKMKEKKKKAKKKARKDSKQH
jgi:hypothetical protein